MIYFDDKKWSKSLDALFNSKFIDEIEDESNLRKQFNKGEIIYSNLDPYSSEIEGVKRLIWDLDKEALNDRYWSSAEDV